MVLNELIKNGNPNICVTGGVLRAVCESLLAGVGGGVYVLSCVGGDPGVS